MLDHMETNTDLITLAQATDTQLAKLHMELTKAERELERMTNALHQDAGSLKRYTSTWKFVWLQSDADALAKAGIRIVTLYAAAQAEVARLEAELEAGNQVWEQHQWSRFFLVTNNGGHVHASMDCRTCRRTTQFGWLPELSGLTEADAVAAHGPLLCSRCFPSAPTDWVK